MSEAERLAEAAYDRYDDKLASAGGHLQQDSPIVRGSERTHASESRRRPNYARPPLQDFTGASALRASVDTQSDQNLEADGLIPHEARLKGLSMFAAIREAHGLPKKRKPEVVQDLPRRPPPPMPK